MSGPKSFVWSMLGLPGLKREKSGREASEGPANRDDEKFEEAYKLSRELAQQAFTSVAKRSKEMNLEFADEVLAANFAGMMIAVMSVAALPVPREVKDRLFEENLVRMRKMFEEAADGADEKLKELREGEDEG